MYITLEYANLFPCHRSKPLPRFVGFCPKLSARNSFLCHSSKNLVSNSFPCHRFSKIGGGSTIPLPLRSAFNPSAFNSLPRLGEPQGLAPLRYPFPGSAHGSICTLSAPSLANPALYFLQLTNCSNAMCPFSIASALPYGFPTPCSQWLRGLSPRLGESTTYAPFCHAANFTAPLPQQRSLRESTPAGAPSLELGRSKTYEVS